MRVIAGRWKGRRLAALKGDRVRPTADRVKEALFSILGPDLTGCCFLDLCCGTGALGIEALSRGAARVYFVDSSRRSLAQVRRNLDLCGAQEQEYRLVTDDALRWLQSWTGPEAGRSWLAVSDPPYASDLAAALLRVLEDPGLPAGFRGAVIEHGPDAALDEAPAGRGRDRRRYGECRLIVVRPPGDGGEAAQNPRVNGD